MTLRTLHPVHLLLALVFAAVGVGATACAPERPPAVAPVRHVFLIVLENKDFSVTFGPTSPAPYLAHELPAQGALLRHYYGIGHNSLGNYIALISGQGINSATTINCPHYSNFQATTGELDENGQLAGSGCVYPALVNTVANQLTAAGLTWKAYMEDMGNDPAREPASCGHVPIGSKDDTSRATVKDQYAQKHNPFVYFHSIIDDREYCAEHVVPLRELQADLTQAATTPDYVFITPDLCHDGHDGTCPNGQVGGLAGIDEFLREWVPRITDSPAFRSDGVLIITFDEGFGSEGCCNQDPTHGGGRIGAVMLSPFIRPGTVSDVPYNHHSTLRSVEEWFGLPWLGYAASPKVHTFGRDVFTRAPRPSP